MVSKTRDLSGKCQFIIAANQSMTWRQTRLFLAATYALSGLILLVCLSLGLWPIIPFAGLELMALTYCLYLVACRNGTREIVTVNEQHVIVEKSRRRVLERQTFPRYWVKVVLCAPPHRWYASRLTIGSHGRTIEVGRCLVEAERIELARELSGSIGQT